ncbi:MAG: hypothetical protein HKN14_11265 [Marinicaulis sp.]|nr:hypothetical protein [Marinicaulis sp.]
MAQIEHGVGRANFDWRYVSFWNKNSAALLSSRKKLRLDHERPLWVEKRFFVAAWGRFTMEFEPPHLLNEDLPVKE